MRALILSLAAALALPAVAEVPVFVLQREGMWKGTIRQGIVRVEMSTGRKTPVADFLHFYGANIRAWGGFQLATVDDRIIAQGTAYYEFDADSGQLLRRYPALGPPYDSWAFHGAIIGRSEAARLGVEPGIYGFPRCTTGPSVAGLACQAPTEAFPGYSQRGQLTDYRVLLHRGLVPDDTDLRVAKFLTPRGFLSLWERFVSLDVQTSRLLFWTRGGAIDSQTLLQLSAASIGSEGIAEEAVLRESVFAPGASYDMTHSIAVDASDDSLLRLVENWTPSGRPGWLVRETLNGTVLNIVPKDALDEAFDSVAVRSTARPDDYTQTIPVVAEAAGANGTYWRSDAWFFNPSSEATDVELQRISGGPVQRFTVQAGASLELRNLLRHLGGGGAGDGAISDAVTVRSAYRHGAQLSVYTRTWTPAPNGGSYGQAVPAVPSEHGYTNHIASTAVDVSTIHSDPMVLMDKRDPGQFRHNLGVVNPSERPLTIRLAYGLPLTVTSDRVVTLNVPARSLRQFPVESLFPAEVFASRPPYITVDGDRPAILWLSIVDNKTGDASFVPFTWFGLDTGPESRLAVPAVVHAAGANGTYWRTDVYGVFQNYVFGSMPQRPDVNFRSACHSGATLQLMPVAPGPQFGDSSPFWWTTFPDVVRQICPEATDVSGALEVRTGSWMTMVSRTYTTRADGGTYGDILPLYPPRGWSSRHFAGILVNESFRANVGLYNGTDAPSTVSLRLYRADGDVVGDVQVALAPRESVQRPLTSYFADLTPGIYGLSVRAERGGGTWPYVSLVDNVTGDPTNWW